VQVAAFGVQNLAKDTLPHHVEDHHFRAVVVAVLHHHAVTPVLLGRLDHRPAVIDEHHRWYFGGRVLAVAHRREHYRQVPFPGCRREHEIEIFGLAQALEVALAPAIHGRGRMARGRDLLRGPVAAFRPDVADRRDPAARDAKEVADVPGALQADAHEADAHHLDGRRRRQASGIPG